MSNLLSSSSGRYGRSQSLQLLIAIQLVGVQEVLLVAMLRLAALCDDVLEDVLLKVTSIAHGSGRHMRRVGIVSQLAAESPTHI
jgi:hypothetical protein